MAASDPGVVTAIDVPSGTLAWQSATGVPTIIATLGSSGQAHVHAIDAATGEPLWVMDSPGGAPALASEVFGPAV